MYAAAYPALLRGRGEVQITKSCLVNDKYCSEIPLKIDTVKDQGVRWGSRTPGTPFPGYTPGMRVLPQ